MKKILLTAVLALVTAVSASAVDIDIKYKGYVDTGGGVFFPSTDETEVDGLGYNYAISTTHGIELFKGLFLGAGFEANLLGYYEKEYPGSYNVVQPKSAAYSQCLPKPVTTSCAPRRSLHL